MITCDVPCGKSSLCCVTCHEHTGSCMYSVCTLLTPVDCGHSNIEDAPLEDLYKLLTDSVNNCPSAEAYLDARTGLIGIIYKLQNAGTK